MTVTPCCSEATAATHTAAAGNFKIKLYRDSNGQPKGDGKCCYLKATCCSTYLSQR